MAVVKSNAYGHSLIDFSKFISDEGADWLGVDSIVEALALRKEGIQKPILILGYTLPGLMTNASEQGISVTVSSMETLEAISKMSFEIPLKVHIKVDTGMYRQGFFEKDLSKVVSKLKASKDKVLVEGLFTHLAAAKNPAFPQTVKKQLADFQKWIDAFKEAGFKPIIHASASAGAMLFPQAQFDMVRIGISIYGLWPSVETESYMKNKIELEPILTWKTLISEIKEVKKGEMVGYDFTEELRRDTKLAVCPIGYWHGFPRALSSIGELLVKGKHCKVLGRVSMDMIMIDVTDVSNLKIGDEAVVIGNSGKETITAEDLGNLSGTSAYEIVTRINPLIKRIFV